MLVSRDGRHRCRCCRSPSPLRIVRKFEAVPHAGRRVAVGGDRCGGPGHASAGVGTGLVHHLTPSTTRVMRVRRHEESSRARMREHYRPDRWFARRASASRGRGGPRGPGESSVGIGIAVGGELSEAGKEDG